MTGVDDRLEDAGARGEDGGSAVFGVDGRHEDVGAFGVAGDVPEVLVRGGGTACSIVITSGAQS